MKKIRVAHVITRLIQGGAQRVCLDLIENLDSQKYECTLVCGGQAGSEGSFFEEAREKKINFIRAPFLVREISPFKDLLAFFHLLFLFSSRRFSIVHLHTSKAGVLGVLAARLAGVPVIIYSSHGHIFDSRAKIRGLPPRLLNFLFWIRKKIYDLSDRVIVLTSEDSKEQERLGLGTHGKFKIIPNAIDLKRFSRTRTRVASLESLRRALDLKAGDFPILLCVARLSPEKGVEHLIRAVPLLTAKLPHLKLWIAGDGPERKNLEKLADALKLKGRIHFLGRRHDVPELLALADIFILPSLYEAMGIAIAEAMAAGLPVIATKVGGVPGIIDDGVHGILVEPQSPEALAEAIEHLAADRTLRERMGANAFERAQQLFSMNTMIHSVTELYEEFLIRKRVLL